MPPAADDQEFSEALEAAAGQCHAELLQRGQENSEFRGMATTLTLYLGVWPRAYLLQVGDSRCYLLRERRAAPDHPRPDDGAGADRPRRPEPERRRAPPSSRTRCPARSAAGRPPPWSPAWISAGATSCCCAATGSRGTSCDERIRDHLRTMTSSRQVCEDLVQEALEGGGSDNITVIVRRAIPSPAQGEPAPDQ